MRAACVIALIGCAALAIAAEQEFPYTAYVADDNVAIRSGPGRNYYAASNLSSSQEIEVYRHEGDWCAIRPPDGCFSWVRADDLQIAHDGVGVVLNDKAACRVGSDVNDLRDVIQVRLERGEEVEVLDAVQVTRGDGIEFYCKIAPPSGEFRWIHKDQISREPLQRGPTLSDRRRPSTSPFADDAEDSDENHHSRSDRWGSWVRSRRASDAPAEGSAEGAADDSSHSVTRSITLAGADAAAPAQDRAESARGDAIDNPDSTSLESRLEGIELELSRMMVEDPSRWTFDPLRKQIERALNQATTAGQRDKVRQVQAKIARLDDIRQRSLTLASPAIPSGGARTAGVDRAITTSASPLAATPAAGVVGSSEAAGRYDGIGKLTRVVSQRPGAPRYALVDGANDVVSFVSPAPGVNLQIFEGQYVGIVGQRGYMPELKKPHVTAQRIHPMQIGQSSTPRRR